MAVRYDVAPDEQAVVERVRAEQRELLGLDGRDGRVPGLGAAGWRRLLASGIAGGAAPLVLWTVVVINLANVGITLTVPEQFAGQEVWFETGAVPAGEDGIAHTPRGDLRAGHVPWARSVPAADLPASAQPCRELRFH